MVFLLQGLQELLSAERLEFVEDTATVREFVKGFTPDELYRLETYRKLNVLCWVKAAGEMLGHTLITKQTGPCLQGRHRIWGRPVQPGNYPAPQCRACRTMAC